mmetsp:Transcript_66899/g.156827  ORF Transcript_66899/g.156827 Transcript_66899/m.156827 type:complete len:334 (-) Transcript_66899:339-1340(-)
MLHLRLLDVLEIRLLLGLVHLVVQAKLLELLFAGLLLGGGVRLQTGEVGSDGLQQASDALRLVQHASVGVLEDVRLACLLRLEERGAQAVAVLELFQHRGGLHHRLLGLLGLLDGRSVGILLLAADLRGASHGLVQLQELLSHGHDVLAQGDQRGIEPVDVGIQLVDQDRLRTPRLLVGLELGGTPGLLLGVGRDLLGQLGDHALNHVLHPVKRSALRRLDQVEKSRAVEALGLLCEEGHHLRLQHVAAGAAECGQRGALLSLHLEEAPPLHVEQRQLLGHDRHSLLHSLQLLASNLLIGLEVSGLLPAGRGHVVEILGVGVLRGGSRVLLVL